MDLSDIKNAVAKFQKEEAPKPVNPKQQVLEQMKGQISKKDLSQMTLHQALEVLTLVLEIPEVAALSQSGETITVGELTRKERGPRNKAKALACEPDEDEGSDGSEDDDTDAEEDAA